MAYFEQRGNGWSVQVRRKGAPSISRTFDLKTDAEALAREVEREHQRGNVMAMRNDAGKVTLGEVADIYLVAVVPLRRSHSAGTHIRFAKERFGKFFLANIRSVDVAAWRDELLRAGYAPQSVIHQLNALSALFSHAEKEMSIPLPAGNPVKAIRKPPKTPPRERRLVGFEYDYLMRAAAAAQAPGLHQALVLAVETSARLSELLSMKWKDVDLQRRTVKLRGVGGRVTKNDDPFRVVALSSAAIEALQSMPRRLDGKVFSWCPTPAKVATFQKAWQRCRARALRFYLADCARDGVEPDPAFLHDLHFHDLRHEATSRLFEKNLGIMEVASMTGHKSLASLKRYTHIEAEKLAAKLG